MTSRRVMMVAGLVVLVVVVVVAGLAWQRLTGPVLGTVKSGQPSGPKVEARPADVQFEGRYFSLVYPDTYRKIGSQANPTTLEALNIIGAKPRDAKELAVSISKFSLQDHPSVRLRRLQRDMYSEQAITGGVLFTRRQGFERAAFLARGDKTASVVLSEQNSNDLSAEHQQILDSFKWLRP